MTMLVLLMGAAPAEALPKATAVSAGGDHTCALLSDATVKCWGANRSGQLGDGTHTRRLTAVAVHGLAGATSVSASASCATLADGTARCWGNNQLGPARGRDDDQPLGAGRRPGPHRRRRGERRRDQARAPCWPTTRWRAGATTPKASSATERG